MNELISVVKTGTMNHAIVKRANGEYVTCFNYNTGDGTWGQGHYCPTYKAAVRELILILEREMSYLC